MNFLVIVLRKEEWRNNEENLWWDILFWYSITNSVIYVFCRLCILLVVYLKIVAQKLEKQIESQENGKSGWFTPTINYFSLCHIT